MMDNQDKMLAEDIIADMQECTSKYLSTKKEIHAKMLEISVNEGLEMFESLMESFDEDDEDIKEIYRLNMLVPIQLSELILLRKQSKEEK